MDREHVNKYIRLFINTNVAVNTYSVRIRLYVWDKNDYASSDPTTRMQKRVQFTTELQFGNLNHQKLKYLYCGKVTECLKHII